MGNRCRLFLGLAVGISLFAAIANAQEPQSLGDVARQQRQQKKESKTAQGAKASKVVTNEEIPERAGASPEAAGGNEASTAAPTDKANQTTEDVKSQIQAQKGEIASLQKQIDALNESIRFAPANCVEGCEQWNLRQKQKQEQVERMQAQLEELKKHLDETQESARKQGLGSSVYEP
jgi:uncharacterized coiled-coil protein SlyX